MVSNKRKAEVDKRFMSAIKSMNLKMNESNVIKLGISHVPLFVIFTVGLGNTFGFQTRPDVIDMDEIKIGT